MELAGLSFLGLGVQPPAAEWGSMINDGRSMLHDFHLDGTAPGVAIFITVMIFNLLGDTLRDYMDPKQRAKNKREEKTNERKIFAVLLTGAMLTAGLSTTVFADGEKTFVYGTTGYSEEMGDAGLNPHDNYSGWSALRYGVGETPF